MTELPTTADHRLDSLDAFHQAYMALNEAEGLGLSVDRPSAPSGEFELRIVLER